MVETASGERIGKVLALLRRDDDELLAVEVGTSPLKRDVRVLPWEDVDRVDHEGLAVRLGIGRDDVEQRLQLDPDKGVEGGGAEAVRVTTLPPRLAPSSQPSSGPVDRPTYAAALGVGAVGLITMLAAVIVAQKLDSTWRFAAFAVPALLLATSAIFAYRLFRNPYERTY